MNPDHTRRVLGPLGVKYWEKFDGKPHVIGGVMAYPPRATKMYIENRIRDERKTQRLPLVHQRLVCPQTQTNKLT